MLLREGRTLFLVICSSWFKASDVDGRVTPFPRNSQGTRNKELGTPAPYNSSLNYPRLTNNLPDNVLSKPVSVGWAHNHCGVSSPTRTAYGDDILTVGNHP